MIFAMPGGAGTLIAGRYALSELVGQGGTGRVWRAHDWVRYHDVAVKEVLLPPLSPQERAGLAARVLREAQAAAQLNHPGVMTVYDVIECDGAPWIIMPFVPGSSLSAQIARLGRLPWQLAARIAGQAAEALARAHAAGIVHRDLKPGNILLTGPSLDRVVVTDFGIAQILDIGVQPPGAGAAPDSLPYLAPERLDGSEAGPAADMWALGVTLYTAVEGRPPFTGATADAVRTAILDGPVPRPEHAGPLGDLIGALLAKDPADRPGAQAAMTAALAATSAAPPAAEPVFQVQEAGWPPLPASTLAGRPERAPRRNVLLGAVGAAAAVALVLVIVLVTAISAPAAKKHGGPPASPRATSSASGQAGGVIQPVPGQALSVDAMATMADPDGSLGIAFSPDGKTVAGSSENNDQSAGHVDIWDARDGRRTAVLDPTIAGGSLLNGMAFSPKDANTLAVADMLGIDIWNLAARSSRTYNPPDIAGVTDVAYAPDGKTLAECDDNGYVYLLDTVNGDWLAQFFDDPVADQTNNLIQVAFSPDGKTLAAADEAGNVYVWRLSGGAPLVIKGKASETYPTQMFAFSPDGRTLAVALQGGVQLWDLATRKLTGRLDDGVTPDAIAFSPTGTALAIGDEDGNLDLWDLATRQVTTADSSGSGWAELEFSPDGKTLAGLYGSDSAVNLFRIGYPGSSPATQFL
jgi:sugar lactone lactonase YvrE